MPSIGRRWKRRSTQPEAVGNDAEAGESHGGGGPGGIEPAKGGDRNAEEVIGEGPAEILVDDAHGAAGEGDGIGDGIETGAEECDITGFDGDTGAGGDGDTCIGLFEGWGIIEAVADHDNNVALGLEFGDGGEFGIGLDAGDDLVDTGLLGDGESGGEGVAGEHEDAEALGAEFGDSGGGIGLDGIGKGEGAEEEASGEEVYGAGGRAGAEGIRAALEDAFDADAGEGEKAGDGEEGETAVAGGGDDGAGEGMFAEAFEAGGEAEDLVLGLGDGEELGLAGGDGTGFIEDDDGGGGEAFEGGAAADEDALACGMTGGGQDGGGDGEAHGTGAGYDEDGDGDNDGAERVGAAEEEPVEGGEGGEGDDGGDEDSAEAVGEGLDGGFFCLGVA